MDQFNFVTCLGTSRSGIVTIAALAERLPNTNFYIVERTNIIEAWNAFLDGDMQSPPLFEQELSDALINGANHITFTDDADHAITSSTVIFIGQCCDLMESRFGKKWGKLEIGHTENAFRHISESANGPKVIIELENIPPESSTNCLRFLQHPNNFNHTLIANPTTFSQGTGLVELRVQHLFLASVKLRGDFDNDNDVGVFLTNLYSGQAVLNQPLQFVMLAPSALELGTLAVSNILANKICFANVVSTISGIRNTSFTQVSRVMASDHRINMAHLVPGPGFGGRSLNRNVLRMIELSKGCSSSSGQEAGKYLKGSVMYNNARERMIVKFVVDKMVSVMRKEVFILGCSIKPGTDDIHEARSIELAKHLLNTHKQCRVRIYDPVVSPIEVASKLVKYSTRYTFTNDLTPDNFEDADAIIVATPWHQIHDLFNNAVSRQMVWDAMRKPATIINIWPLFVLPYANLRNLGFAVYILDGG